MKKVSVIVALLLVLVWCYRPVWTAGWVYEDFSTQHYINRPVTLWTWSYLNRPLAAHALNLALSLLVAGLLVWLASRLGIRGIGLWTVGAGWLLHPINVESVAYAASRGELLAAIGILTACLAASGRWWRLSHLTVIGFGLGWAMASKESGVIGIALVPLVIWYVNRPTWISRWMPVLVAGLILSVGVWWKGGVTVVANIGNTDFANTRDVSWQSWSLWQATALNHWLGSFVWLTGMSPDVDIDLVPRVAQGFLLAMVYGYAVCAWFARQTYPIIAFGLAWMLIAVAPRFLVQTPQSYLNAHQMAVPIMGVLFICGSLMMSLQDWATA